MPKALEYNATLIERVDLTSALSIFRVMPDEGIPCAESEADWFIPGQYMVIGCNNEDVPELGKVQRPMSIASAPSEKKYIEFYIRYVSQATSKNPLTHLLWKLKEGDRVFVRTAAKGHFNLQHLVPDLQQEQRQLVFVSAGTGLAPFLSIARDFADRGAADQLKRCTIMHGSSYPNELGYKEEIAGLCQQYDLNYLGTVSRPNEAGDYSGPTGRVETHFEGDKLAQLESLIGLEAGGFVPSKVLVFICGLQGTISQTIEHLAARGFIPDNKRIRKALGIAEDREATLFFEQYDSEPVIDLEDAELLARLAKNF